MKRNLLAVALLTLAGLALWTPGASAGVLDCIFNHNLNKYSTFIMCRPYNAFTPVCYGSMTYDGCCPPLPMCPSPCMPSCGSSMYGPFSQPSCQAPCQGGMCSGDSCGMPMGMGIGMGMPMMPMQMMPMNAPPVGNMMPAQPMPVGDQPQAMAMPTVNQTYYAPNMQQPVNPVNYQPSYFYPVNYQPQPMNYYQTPAQVPNYWYNQGR